MEFFQVLKGFMKKYRRIFIKKRTSSKQHLNPFVKASMYVFLFVVIPALFVRSGGDRFNNKRRYFKLNEQINRRR